MLKSYRLILPFLIFCISTVCSQSSIKGFIFDKQNRLPIEFASVGILLLPDSSVINGTLTDVKGGYSISSVPSGNILIKIVALGYEPYYHNITVLEGIKAYAVDNLYLDISSDLLNEVLVTGQKSTSSNKLDKQTFRAAQFESAKGGSATDVLKNLPSIAVNSSGEISLRGSTGFLLLIDGKPVLTDAQTILSQLPANTIDNVELLTAPSAKYDADGKAGIINITTKKGTTDGVAFQLNGLGGLPSTTNYNNIEQPKRYGFDGAVSIKKNKWDVSISGNYTRNDANGNRVGDVFTKNFINNTITRFPSSGERSFDRYNYGVRTAMVFTIDKNNVFNAGLFASKKYQQRRADIVYNNSLENLTTGAILRTFNYFNSNLQNKEGNFLMGSLDYMHTFSNSSKITTSFIYEKANLLGNTINKNLNHPEHNTSLQLVTNPYTNPIGGYRLKLDYTIPTKNGKWEAGYQFRYDSQDGNFDYNVTPASNQSDIAKFRGSATSTNQINSIYTQYTGKAANLQYTSGLRYEYADREVILSSDVNPHLLKLSNLFPSLNLLYTIDPFWTAKAGYSKRVQRNNNFELNPIPEREHSETLEQGDPDLLPQFIDLVEIGVSRIFDRGSFFTTLYYQNIQNPIQRVNSVYADTILNRLFTNAGNARLFGIELGNTIKPIKNISIYTGANIYNYKISGELDVLGTVGTINNANWVYSLNMNTTFELGNRWNLQANVNYLSARPTAQGEDSRFLIPNTSLKKSFSEGRYNLGLQWQNMNLGFMNANQQRISTWGKDFYTTTNYIYETDILLLNFSISLNKLSKTKLPTSELGEKEF